jgi:hypothetical protein
MFTPDAATQTAEGAQLQREGLVFKVEDRENRATLTARARCSRSRSRSTRTTGTPTSTGAPDRADIDRIGIDWMPADRFSLAERASAATQAEAPGSRGRPAPPTSGSSRRTRSSG